MKKNIIFALVLIITINQIILAQIKFYTATGKDSISYVATNQGLLILKRDSNQILTYYSVIDDSNKIYNRAFDNDSNLILVGNNSIDLFSLSNKYKPSYIGSLYLTNVITIRPFGDNFAIIRGSKFNYDKYEQYIIGSENDSIKILSSINSNFSTYTGRTAFYPEVVYPYFFSKGNNSSIVMYKYNEERKKFEFIDTLNLVTPGNDLVEMFGAKNELFILERYTYYDHNSLQYYLFANKYSTSDTLQFLTQALSFSTGAHLIDEIECTDSLIRYNGSLTYLNSKKYLTEPNGYSISGLSGYRIYYISNDKTKLYYSTDISNYVIHTSEFIYNPSSVKDRPEADDFKLFQNYPNPFNPLTTIYFHISKSSEVKLKIYDILGKEIKTLLNNDMKPGNYNIQFNAQNLPSGIYFYRLTAGPYTSTKKMIYLK